MLNSTPPASNNDHETELLIDVLPPALQEAVRAVEYRGNLVEIVMDLGRRPEARGFDKLIVFDELEVSEDDIEHVISRIGEFTDDNRAGIARTLHRISAMRNRQGRIIGLSLRVGRAVYGTVEIVRDIMESGQSVLLLGRPAVGKTTMLRETARILAANKRVVIVDTSNEIAGDGDIPHPAIGRARRMQVAKPALQHEVMIEAVENHMPEVVVIDEIGRELEAQAARTIAERGVQLIGTAHGKTLENLLMNPTLSDLVGGIESVTLSDEEARRRGTQKSVLERRAPPTFDALIELQDFQRLAVHHDVGAAVDALLRGRPLSPELRHVGEDSKLVVESAPPPAAKSDGSAKPNRIAPTPVSDSALPAGETRAAPVRRRKIYPYGVSQNRLRQAGKALSLPLILTDDLSDADAMMTLKGYYRKRPAIISDAEAAGIPVYVLRSNTHTQIEHALVDIFGIAVRPEAFETAIQEAQEAIHTILSGSRNMVELSPQNSTIRRWQHDMARKAKLQSWSRGKEPYRRVRINKSDRA
jgi:stage III sporulation protein SpoIIIAA